MNSIVRARRASGAGFSLVEVIISLGILGGALVAIGTMFVLGGRQLKSAGRLTQASALAQDIMETFEGTSFVSLYGTLRAGPADTRCTVSSVEPDGPISAWQEKVARQLGDGMAEMTLQAIGPGTPSFGEAEGIRVTVVLRWDEHGRKRSLGLTTVRF